MTHRKRPWQRPVLRTSRLFVAPRQGLAYWRVYVWLRAAQRGTVPVWHGGNYEHGA